MRLLLRRSQKTALMGAVSFVLTVRADLTEEERRNIDRYRLGDTILYTRDELVDPGSGLAGLASRLAFKALNISVSVDDLVKGKRIDCQDIVEMLAVEEQLREASRTFKAVLEVAASFGGEDVVALD
jgi:hypothetical protein